MNELSLRSASAEASLEIGERFGRLLIPGDVVALWGELGAGKTLFTRGIAHGLGISPEIPITSPTFTFINEYDGRHHLYHLDLYRLSHPDELDTLPMREVLFGDGIAVIEWPDRLFDLLPECRWDIRIEITDEHERLLTLQPIGQFDADRLSAMNRDWK